MHRCLSKTMLAQMTKMLNEAGYTTWPTHRTRRELVALLVILVNQVAAATGRSVWQVRDAVRIALRCTLRGSHFAPWTVRAMWARMPEDGGRGGEHRDDQALVCPCCGQRIPGTDRAETPLDPGEIPQDPPQSGGCEV